MLNSTIQPDLGPGAQCAVAACLLFVCYLTSQSAHNVAASDTLATRLSPVCVSYLCLHKPLRQCCRLATSWWVPVGVVFRECIQSYGLAWMLLTCFAVISYYAVRA